tara:strand:+ start:16598 stop:18703 length:2106 start_codon:yes stop_codon:yes gene_type:complete
MKIIDSRYRLKVAISATVLTVIAAGSSAAVLAQSEEETLRANALFNWAEYAYPQLFYPSGATTVVMSEYMVRHYSGSENYLGVKQGTVYGYGPAFSQMPDAGGDIRYVGKVEEFADVVSADGFGISNGKALRISEAVAKDADGGPDWFELYASGLVPVLLSDYQVRDGADDRELITLPAVTLNPGEYIVIFATEGEVPVGQYSVPFKLSSNDRVQLYLAGEILDDLDWDDGEAPQGYSFGRYPGPQSAGRLLLPTPGNMNKAAPIEDVAGVLASKLGAVGTMSSLEVHAISVNFDETDYVTMINNYLSSSEKTWIEADVEIDGTLYTQVGMRLKGNSSLRGITLEDNPATTPWLIKFDKFIDGQDHNGLEEFVIRSNASATAINEAVALDLMQLAGLPSQDAIETSFSVNGGAAVLRLAIEHPDDEWMKKNFSSTGALYKAESTGNYSYRGDDPLAYENVFDQEAGKANADLSPLIDFLKFINEADDAAFKAGLANRLDVDSFAIYLAMQDLLDNFDDIDGPGNNSYLYYSPEADQFTIVPWDYNLAFGQQMLPGGAPGNGEFPDGWGGPGDGAVPPGAPAGGPPVDGAVPPRGGPGGLPTGGLPTGGVPPGGFPTDGEFPPRDGAGGFGGGSNILAQRFLADAEWNALYVEKQTELRSSLYASDQASGLLLLWEHIVRSSGLVEEAVLSSEIQRISPYFE